MSNEESQSVNMSWKDKALDVDWISSPSGTEEDELGQLHSPKNYFRDYLFENRIKEAPQEPEVSDSDEESDSFFLPPGIADDLDGEEKWNQQKNQTASEAWKRPPSPWNAQEMKGAFSDSPLVLDRTWVDHSYFQAVRKKHLSKSISDGEADRRTNISTFSPVLETLFANSDPLSRVSTTHSYNESPIQERANVPYSLPLQNSTYITQTAPLSPPTNSRQPQPSFSSPMSATSAQFTPLSMYPPPPLYFSPTSSFRPLPQSGFTGYWPAHPRSPKWQYYPAQPKHPHHKPNEEKRRSQWKIKVKQNSPGKDNNAINTSSTSESESSNKLEELIPIENKQSSQVSLVPLEIPERREEKHSLLESKPVEIKQRRSWETKSSPHMEPKLNNNNDFHRTRTDIERHELGFSSSSSPPPQDKHSSMKQEKEYETKREHGSFKHEKGTSPKQKKELLFEPKHIIFEPYFEPPYDQERLLEALDVHRSSEQRMEVKQGSPEMIIRRRTPHRRNEREKGRNDKKEKSKTKKGSSKNVSNEQQQQQSIEKTTSPQQIVGLSVNQTSTVTSVQSTIETLETHPFYTMKNLVHNKLEEIGLLPIQLGSPALFYLYIIILYALMCFLVPMSWFFVIVGCFVLLLLYRFKYLIPNPLKFGKYGKK